MLIGIAKSVLVGICAAAPLGPVAFLVMQKTLTESRREGIVTGVGSMLADSLFALAGFLTLSAISSFVDANTIWIYLIGGMIVLCLGLSIAWRNPYKKMANRDRRIENREQRRVRRGKRHRYLSNPAQTFFSALANPAALAVMVALLAFFGLDSDVLPAFVAIPCVALGEMVWWFFFTFLVSKIERHLSPKVLITVNLLLGAMVAVFGAVLVVKGLILMI